MKEFGCGVVAMSDLQLYLTQTHNGYFIPGQEKIYDEDTGYIEKDEYMKYAEYNRDNLYYLKANLWNYIAGVTPDDMKSGIENYLESNNHPYTEAVWAPQIGGKWTSKTGVANKIETMLFRNLPVVFSYHTFSNKNEDKLVLYTSLENAKKRIKPNLEPVKSHYMTIIGYSKYLKKDGINYSYILKVVSWGDIYYIDYDEYAEKLSYFSNILEIR